MHKLFRGDRSDDARLCWFTLNFLVVKCDLLSEHGLLFNLSWGELLCELLFDDLIHVVRWQRLHSKCMLLRELKLGRSFFNFFTITPSEKVARRIRNLILFLIQIHLIHSLCLFDILLPLYIWLHLTLNFASLKRIQRLRREHVDVAEVLVGQVPLLLNIQKVEYFHNVLTRQTDSGLFQSLLKICALNFSLAALI